MEDFNNDLRGLADRHSGTIEEQIAGCKRDCPFVPLEAFATTDIVPIHSVPLDLAAIEPARRHNHVSAASATNSVMCRKTRSADVKLEMKNVIEKGVGSLPFRPPESAD